MEGGGFFTGLMTGDDDHVAGLEDLTFPMTQGTLETQDGPVEEEEEVEVQLQQSQDVRREGRGKGLAKRTKNFDKKEDLLLCSAWLNVSKDPINGANQSRGIFWKRVHVYFEKHKETPHFRTESSLLHRWQTIQFQVNKFCACYEQIEGRNQSGKTIGDKISDALEMYEKLDNDKKKFTLVPCWNKLKGEDKWKAKRVELAEQEKEKLAGGNKKQKLKIDSTPMNMEAITIEDEEIAAPECEARKRPEGVKKAKEALKRGGAEACLEALDKIFAKKNACDLEREKKKEERFLISLEVENKRLAIEDKRAEADLMREEKEIMQMDLTSLDPLTKQYYETMKQKIILRCSAN